ncbi:MAG: hypothetical protein ACYSTL_06290, partial [Planctomycetota bacterium]
MKAKRRHELQENVLSSEIVKVAQFFRKRGGAVAWGVLVAGLILFVIFYARQRAAEADAQLREQFARAVSDMTLAPPDRVRMLLELLKQEDNRVLAARAGIHLANEHLRQINTAGPSAEPAEISRMTEMAIAVYRQVIQRFPDMKLPTAQAHLGLGKIAENKGLFDAASEQ